MNTRRKLCETAVENIEIGTCRGAEPTYYDSYECRIVVLINQKISIIAPKIQVIFLFVKIYIHPLKKVHLNLAMIKRSVNVMIVKKNRQRMLPTLLKDYSL